MMKEFTLAALPWILAGLAVAIICAGMDKQKSTKKEKEAEEHIATGAALGLIFGVALNYLGCWDNQALGLSLGPLWGMALAMLWEEHNGGRKE